MPAPRRSIRASAGPAPTIGIPNTSTRCSSVAVVDGLDAALAHIARHSSGHTDAIVTSDPGVAERFLAEVDSAIVMVNA